MRLLKLPRLSDPASSVEVMWEDRGLADGSYTTAVILENGDTITNQVVAPTTVVTRMKADADWLAPYDIDLVAAWINPALLS